MTGGQTLRAHLLSVYRQTKKLPEKLAKAPRLPDAVKHVWEWFKDLSDARSSNGFGSNPIGYSGIKDWSEMTGEKPTPWEVKLLIKLDKVFRIHQQAGKKDK